MRTLLALVGLVIIVVIVLMAFGMINIDQTKTAQLPTVSVNGGQAPAFQADVGKVSVGSVNKTVAVPTVSVEKAGNAAAPQ